MSIEYDHSIVKTTKSGATALSTRLEPGEKLANGRTYKQELKRLAVIKPESSPFAQGSLTEHNNPENPSPALTLSDDGVNTKREGDEDPQPLEYAPVEPDLVATSSEDGNSTVIVEGH